MRYSSPFLWHLCAKPAPSSCHGWQWIGEDQSRAFPSPSIANRGRNLMVVPASNRENWVNAKCNGNHHQIHATIPSCRFCRSCQKTLYLYDFSGFRIPKPPFFVGSMFRNLSVSSSCLLTPVSFPGVKENLPPQFRPAIIDRYRSGNGSFPTPNIEGWTRRKTETGWVLWSNLRSYVQI